MTAKRFCFIGGGLAGGGQERALSSMANHLAERGYHVSIINLFKTEQFFELNENIQLYWRSADKTKMHKFLYAIKIIPCLRSAIRKEKPDVLLSYGEWFNSFVILFTKSLKVPLIVLDRMGPNINLGWLIKNARKLFYRFADGVIVQKLNKRKIYLKKN